MWACWPVRAWRGSCRSGGDGAEIRTISKERHVSYWMAQAFPVLLVIRTSEGEIRWMEVREWLKRAGKPVNQIVFEGSSST